MSLNLSISEVKDRINSKKINIDHKTLLIEFHKVFEINRKLINFLESTNYSGFESDKTIGKGSESSGITSGQGTNPLLWEIGHFCYFYEYHCFKYLEDNYKFFISNGDIYDSFVSDRSLRFDFQEHSKDLIFKYVDYVEEKILKILSKQLSHIARYTLTLGLMHNHMHCESFYFTKKLLGIDNYMKNYKLDYEINFEFIDIKGGEFIQGTYEGENNIAFDNEMPQFKTNVNDFTVSKYCVTEEIVVQFIKSNGYNNKKYWSDNGWRFIKNNNINLPFYWISENNNILINDNGKIRSIKSNLPASHMTWYEAEAICSFLGGRLPTESEWEYLATNCGTTKYPWGNEMNVEMNINYSGSICEIDKFPEADNKNGISQLIGNVWEWCQEPIYPYDGFCIDPVYKEFSYPFFGFKKILRGGSWAVPGILINSRYRNAQMPDCRIQFTGFRVVKHL